LDSWFCILTVSFWWGPSNQTFHNHCQWSIPC